MKRSALLLFLSILGYFASIETGSAQSVLWNRPHFFDPASAIRFTPDGKKVVVGTADSTIQIYSVEKIEKELEIDLRHYGMATALAVLSDGRIIAGTNSGDICVCDPSGGDVFRASQLNGPVTSVEARVNLVAAISAFGEASVWDLNFAPVFSTVGTASENNHVAISADLKRFAVSVGLFANIYDLTRSDIAASVVPTDTVDTTKFYKTVLDVAFTPDGSRLLYTREGLGLLSFGVTTGLRDTLLRYNLTAGYTVFNTEGTRVSYQSPQGINVFDAERREAVGTWPLAAHPFFWAIDARGDRLLVSTRDGLDLIGLDVGLISSFWGMNYPITGVVANSDGSQIVSIDSRHGVMVGWESSSGRRLWTQADAQMLDQSRPVISSDPNTFLHARQDGTVGLYSMLNGQKLSTIGMSGDPHVASAICRSGDTAFFFMTDNTMQGWEISTGTQVLSGASPVVPRIATVSPSGALIAVADNSHVAILDRRTLRETQYFEPTPNFALTLEFTQDDAQLIVGTTLNTIKYQVTNVAQKEAVPVQGFSIFLPDHSEFVSLGSDSTLQRYSIQTGLINKQHLLLAQTGAYAYMPRQGYVAVGSILGDLQLLKLTGLNSVHSRTGEQSASISLRDHTLHASGVGEGGTDIALYDLAGRAVLSRHFEASSDVAVDLDQEPQVRSGVFIATARSGRLTISSRIVLIR